MSESINRGGRPPFMPTRDQRNLVKTLVSNGNGERVIAELPGVDRKTLRKHFREELRTGREHVLAMVGAAVVESAISGNVLAQKYWLATHGGPEWKEKSQIEVTDAGQRDIANMTTAQLEAELAEIDRKRRNCWAAFLSVAEQHVEDVIALLAAGFGRGRSGEGRTLGCRCDAIPVDHPSTRLDTVGN